VEVELSTHSAGGVTDLDVQLAGVVDEVAADLPLAG
jgi:pterin-4a-carbinolamine dehydratase